jgi:hypothetical protein
MSFPTGYSLPGCSPALPASASPAALILNRKQLVRQQFSANGNRSLLLFVSIHRAVQSFLVVLRLVPGWFCVKCLEIQMFRVFYAFPRAHVYTRTPPKQFSYTRVSRWNT